jgi:serine/threonine protein kinase
MGGRETMLAMEKLSITHYRLMRRLAQGGMSEIYLAEDSYTRQLVAMKLVNIAQREFQERFQREVEAMAALQHDHILPVFDYGVAGQWYYMVMPFIAYGTLRDRLARGPLSLKEAGKVLEQLADALSFAHSHKLLHRDIKPSNILLRDGEHVYLADFGLVKYLEGETGITQTGCLIGTPEYMAPELAEGEATPRSDIYAVGVVLYQMLTGQVPFKSNTPMGVYWKHQREQPIPPSALNATIPQAVELVILRALEKNPQRRFSTVRELANAYRQAITSQTRRQVSSDTPPVGTLLPIRSHSWETWQLRYNMPPAKAAATALVVLLLFCILPTALGFTLYQDQNHRAAPVPNLGANALVKDGLPSLPPADLRNTAHHLIPRVSHATATPARSLVAAHPPSPQGGGNDDDSDHDGGHGHKHRGDDDADDR